jgi:hypothetical protein
VLDSSFAPKLRAKLNWSLILAGVTQKPADAPLVILVLLSLGLNAFWLWWGLPNAGHTWAVDVIAPLEPLVAAKRLFIDDWWNSGYVNKYPMGHFFLLMVVYAPYILYLFATGGLGKPTDDYPYGLNDPEAALTVLTLLANGVSALMGVGIVVLTYLTARDLFGARGAFFSALIVALSPPFIYYSHTSNVDVPSLFWCSLGLFAFARIVQGNMHRYNYLVLGVAAGMAMATKEQVLGFFILLPVPILIVQIMAQRRMAAQPVRSSIPALRRALIGSNVLLGLGTCILTFVLATHLIFNWDANLWRLIWRISHVQPELQLKYVSPSLELRGVLDAWQQTFWLLWDSMNPALFIASILGIITVTFKERWAGFFLVPLLSHLLLFIPMLNLLRARFVMQLILVLAFFGGRFISQVCTWGSKRTRALFPLSAMLWAYSFVYGFSVDYLMMYDSRYKAEAWMQAHLATGATVETYSQPTYLPRLPKNLRVNRAPFTDEGLAGLRKRSPEYLVLTSAEHDDLQEEALLTRLLQGGFGYRVIQSFQTEPLLGRNLIPGLSPQITILQRVQ